MNHNEQRRSPSLRGRPESRAGGGFADRQSRSPSLRGRPGSIDAVFHALADPTRRQLLGRLAAEQSATATELAAHVPVTRQAVVKHLQSLGTAGLVEPVREGREVRYALTPAPLDDALGWMVEVGARWDQRLARLRRRFEPPRAT